MNMGFPGRDFRTVGACYLCTSPFEQIKCYIILSSHEIVLFTTKPVPLFGAKELIPNDSVSQVSPKPVNPVNSQ